MVIIVEIVGWLLFGLAVLSMMLNNAHTRRDTRHRHQPVTRQLVLGCLVAGSSLVALAYGLRQLDLGDTLIDSGRRGGSLWVMVVVFAVTAVCGVIAWRKGDPQAR